MVVEREERNRATEGNPLTSVRHLSKQKNNECLGLMVWLWCPGCQSLHSPRFRCPEHGGPSTGPVWDGDPYSDPFTMSPSLLIYDTPSSPLCHSFIKNGHWEFLNDSKHSLAGLTIPLEPLPDWLAKDNYKA